MQEIIGEDDEIPEQPPFVLEFQDDNKISVSTYKLEKTSPYPSETPRLNQIRFTSSQGSLLFTYK